MVESLWDDRDWMLSLKADNPATAYSELFSQRTTLRNAEKLEDLPKEQQDWLRAT